MSVHVQEILAGIGAFLFAVICVGASFLIAHENNDKVREMTRVCVAQDYRGWDDQRGCFK